MTDKESSVVLPDSNDDSRHLDAWADTGDGYYIVPTRWVLHCMWCDYKTFGKTQREAIANYRREHEGPILERNGGSV